MIFYRRLLKYIFSSYDLLMTAEKEARILYSKIGFCLDGLKMRDVFQTKLGLLRLFISDQHNNAADIDCVFDNG